MSLEDDLLLKPKPAPATTLGRYLKRTGIAAAELARAIGVNKSTITRIVAGASCSETTRRAILKATGLKRID